MVTIDAPTNFAILSATPKKLFSTGSGQDDNTFTAKASSSECRERNNMSALTTVRMTLAIVVYSV